MISVLLNKIRARSVKSSDSEMEANNEKEESQNDHGEDDLEQYLV